MCHAHSRADAAEIAARARSTGRRHMRTDGDGRFAEKIVICSGARNDARAGHMTADDPSGPAAFEVIAALPGFCRLEKRSPTLGGSLPLRAAQHCSPVFEGNAAGFQICLEQPIALARRGRRLAADLTPPAFQQTQQEVRGAIERLVAAGLLARGGHWHRLLARDAIPFRGARAFLWTGFLVRPAPGVCLRVGPAFNRRSRVRVVEHAIADRSGFTPLVLEIDGRDLGPEGRWLEDEIGCVLPVAARARMTLAPIRRAPAVVAAFESFFDAHYFATKREKPTGKYRRLVRETEAGAEAGDAATSATCHAKVFYAGPPVHELATLDRFHGPAGVSRAAPAGVSLPYCTVRNVARVDATYDGQSFTSVERATAGALRALERDWRRAGGHPDRDAYEFLNLYFYGEQRAEPYWLLQPWVFTVTSPGWSTCLDGIDVGDSDGMRGILRTDRFHSVGMVYRMYGPGRVRLRLGAPLLRFYPIPRRLQDAHMTKLEVI
jgi:hypothetical protein